MLILPWLLFFVILTFMALAPNSGRVSSGLSETRVMVLTWAFIGLVNDLFAAGRLSEKGRRAVDEELDQWG